MGVLYDVGVVWEFGFIWVMDVLLVLVGGDVCFGGW